MLRSYIINIFTTCIILLFTAKYSTWTLSPGGHGRSLPNRSWLSQDPCGTAGPRREGLM